MKPDYPEDYPWNDPLDDPCKTEKPSKVVVREQPFLPEGLENGC